MPFWSKNGEKSSRTSKMFYQTSRKSTRLWSREAFSSLTCQSSRARKANNKTAEATNQPPINSQPTNLQVARRRRVAEAAKQFQPSSKSLLMTWTWSRATSISPTKSSIRQNLVSAQILLKTCSERLLSWSPSSSTWLPRLTTSMWCPCASSLTTICIRLLKGTEPLRRVVGRNRLYRERTCRTRTWVQATFTLARPQAM